MLLREYKREYKDYFMFMELHHSMVKVSMHSYIDDDFSYKSNFMDYSLKEIYKILCNKIDNNSF